MAQPARKVVYNPKAQQSYRVAQRSGEDHRRGQFIGRYRKGR